MRPEIFPLFLFSFVRVSLLFLFEEEKDQKRRYIYCEVYIISLFFSLLVAEEQHAAVATRAVLGEDLLAQVMSIEVRDCPPLTLFATPHRGAYNLIGSAFERLAPWATSHGFTGYLVAVYFDDPNLTPEADLKSAAGVIVPQDTAIPAPSTIPIDKVDIPAGPYGILLNKGPYSTLPDGFYKLYAEWLPQSGRTAILSNPALEVYLNSPHNTPEDELLTEIRAPLQP